MLSVVHFLLVICRCKCWVINCRRADLDKKSAADLNKCYFVCGHHFEESQFLNGLRNRLVWKAVPTLFKIQDVSTYNFATSWSNVTKLYLCSQVHVMEEQFREKCPELCVGKSIAQKLYEHMYPALDFTLHLFLFHILSMHCTCHRRSLSCTLSCGCFTQLNSGTVTLLRGNLTRKGKMPMGLKHCEKYRRSCISDFIKLCDGHYVIYGIWNLSCVTDVKV